MLFRSDKKDDGGEGADNTVQAPLLPLRDIIVFPHMVVPLFVGRQKSIRALEEASRNQTSIFLASQKDARTNEPGEDDIYPIGTLGNVVQMLKLPDGTVKVLVEGKRRGRIARYLTHPEFFLVEVEELEDVVEQGTEVGAVVREVHSAFENYVKVKKKIPPEMVMSVSSIEEPGKLADTIIGHLGVKLEERQVLLETINATERLEKVLGHMRAEIEILEVERRIRSRVKKQMERSQKEYYLNEQMRAIQKELGEKDEFKNEMQEIEEKIKQKKLSAEAKEKVEKELKKLKMMSPMSAEATVVRNYIDWILSLPWYDYTEDKLDIGEAEKVLEDDHYGLGKVKERILEYLAVQSLVGKIKGPILCLVGPPGVGKTSLGRSIARATGREFVRVSLGGVRDEAEIRGHRRTYIGALPGKIIQSLKKAGSSNPVFLMDEVDKMSMDFRGDPSSALLEVLDPEQNHGFSDHYLEVPYDLSKVLFIATANVLDPIIPALRDRLEVLELPGYTEDEKIHIAQRFLAPKQAEENGLGERPVAWGEEPLLQLIRGYTHEAGVRNLEREIGGVNRKVAKTIADGGKPPTRITMSYLAKAIGPARYTWGAAEEQDEVGVATGVARTAVGGDVLSVEVSVVDGKGDLTLTGSLGDVMKESAQAALSYARARSHSFKLPPKVFEENNIHIHVPSGAVPKDGPSAGVTLATALVSALGRMPVRKDVAMTGEVTLRGRVLEVGGIKEKVLAAHRAGIKTFVLPKKNNRDLEDVPTQVRRTLTFVPVENMDEVLAVALLPMVRPEA